MPLSEHEQRLLEQLEKQLHEDHRFASTMKSSSGPGGYSTRNIAIGALVAVVGIIVLLLGISSQLIAVGVVGFVVMCAGVYVAVSKSPFGRLGGKGEKPAKGKSGFMADLESKWDQRREGEQ